MRKPGRTAYRDRVKRTQSRQTDKPLLLFLALLLVLATTFVASGSGESSAATTTRPKATSPKPSPTKPKRRVTTTTVSPIVAAGQNYLSIVRAPNCAVDSWGRAESAFNEYLPTEFLNPDGSLDSPAAYAWWSTNVLPSIVKVRDSILVFSQFLIALPWPSQAQASINSLVSANSREATELSAYIASSDLGSVLRWRANFSGYEQIRSVAIAAAAEVRLRLGLPTNLGMTGGPC